MDEHKCAKCGKPATSTCSKCMGARYCGRDCQKGDWKNHRKVCQPPSATPKSAAGPQIVTGAPSKPATNSPTAKTTSSKMAPESSSVKENSFIIRAKPKDPSKSVHENIKDQLEPLHLTHIGSENAEKHQLQRDLNWPEAIEVGKFYDHEGTDDWYYFVYGSTKAYNKGSAQKNELASLVCYQAVYGDVVVVRSGPIESTYSEMIDKTKLEKTIEFHKTHNRSEIFAEREKSRMFRKMGLPKDMMDRVLSISLH